MTAAQPAAQPPAAHSVACTAREPGRRESAHTCTLSCHRGSARAWHPSPGCQRPHLAARPQRAMPLQCLGLALELVALARAHAVGARQQLRGGLLLRRRRGCWRCCSCCCCCCACLAAPAALGWRRLLQRCCDVGVVHERLGVEDIVQPLAQACMRQQQQHQTMQVRQQSATAAAAVLQLQHTRRGERHTRHAPSRFLICSRCLATRSASGSELSTTSYSYRGEPQQQPEQPQQQCQHASNSRQRQLWWC
jgi:hypothetical protein